MKRFQKILAATDTRYDSHPIVAAAAELAERNGASLKIVDVVPDFPWAVRLTLKNHEHVRQLMEQEKREKLAALAAPIRDRGVEVETRVLCGKTSVELIRETLRHQHDLVMRVAKGLESRHSGPFGNTGLRLLRKCPCPVWLVARGAATKFKRVLACVEVSTGDEVDEELNVKVLELASSVSDYHQGRLSIVHAWDLWNEQMLKSHMKADEFANLEGWTYDRIAAQMDAFLERHGWRLRDENVHLLKGEPSMAIPKFVREQQVELVVMGTVARAGLSGVVMGNTAERILNQIECSVLALKPDRFVSPITLS